MNARRTVWAAAGLAAGFSLLVACGSAGPSAAVSVPPASIGAVVDGLLPAAIAHMPLTEANGTRTDLAAFRGKTVMVADFMTLCTDVCPLISANAVSLARTLATDGLSGRTALLEITLDPRRDTASRLRAYQDLYGPRPPNWYLLRASPRDTKTFWKYFGVYRRRVKEGTPPDRDWLTGKPLTYDIAHSDDLVFLGSAGEERFVIDGNPDTRGQAPPRVLRNGLSAQGRRDLRHPNAVEDWTTSQALRVFDWLLGHRVPDPPSP